jgi:hypothetical protein
VADATVGAQAAALRGDSAHQLIRVQAALHQHLAFSGVDQFDSFGGRLVAVCGINDLETGNIETKFGGRIRDLLARTHQHRLDDAGARAV